jgi:ribonucleoside-triphosphate reductase (thioredoxin)
MRDIHYPNLAAEFVALTHYCRWLPGKNRRERWDEVVDRVIEFLKTARNAANVPDGIWQEIRDGVDSFSVMPAMRVVATAGAVANENNISCYNCAYAPIDDLRSFSELMYVLLCGTGMGFSVERANVEKLPVVALASNLTTSSFVIEDSREGWASAFLFGLETWFAGGRVEFDYSKIRPYGARLQRMGGRASGPGPLRNLFQRAEQIVRSAAGRKLTPLECHDTCCYVGYTVVSGGTRRAAMISFSDLDDDELRHAKDPPIPAQRFMSNNTAVYGQKPTKVKFRREWLALAASGSGERGILNLAAIAGACPTRRFTGAERTNPCGEIILRPYEMCNLTEAVVRPTDAIGDVERKVRIATWLGVLQPTFTHFPFVRDQWRKNCEEERLLGVSPTGQLDNPALLTPGNLRQLRSIVRETSIEVAKRLEISSPAAYTCSKPSGTVSQVADCSPGAHPRWSRHYIRRYRIAKSDPVFAMLVDQGMPFNPEVGQTRADFTTAVFDFPMKSPEHATVRADWDAVAQLDWYRRVQKNWSTHNVSTTVYVKKDEWPKVGDYVFEYWAEIVGVSFLPYEGGTYELTPYEEIDEERYRQMVAAFPKLDFSKLWLYELRTGDTTMDGQVFGCVPGSYICEAL